MSASELIKIWLDAKEAEAAAVAARRDAEDKLLLLIGIPDNLDGTENVELDGYRIKITGRINRTVDSDLVQELAAEHGLTEHLGSLFRWKPEISMAAWKAADPSITTLLAAAITAKPGRPSFSITKKEEK